jgi:hypothetical protein
MAALGICDWLRVSAADLRRVRTREIGYEAPEVPFPKTVDDIGRQWTTPADR